MAIENTGIKYKNLNHPTGHIHHVLKYMCVFRIQFNEQMDGGKCTPTTYHYHKPTLSRTKCLVFIH